MIGRPDLLTDITVAMDKFEKVGLEAVEEELMVHGLDGDAIKKLRPILTFTGSTEEKIALMERCFLGIETGMDGIAELKILFGLFNQVGMTQQITLDLSLARGLSYYTGAIFEVKALDFEMGSICGGGRYDNLTGVFGLPGMSGVGISFGADRIYDVLLGLEKFPPTTNEAPKVLFMNLGKAESAFALTCLKHLRALGIASELYPDQTKMKKQFDYADKRGIPFVAIIGEEELKQGVVALKNLATGTQQSCPITEIESILKV